MLRKHIDYTLPLFLIIILSGIVGCVRPAGADIAPQVAQLPTFTVTPSETFVPTVTLTPSETAIVLVTEVTATATATPTATPTLTPVQNFLAQSAQEATIAPDVVVNEFQLTATAIVAGATATIDAQFTATALAAGIGLPTQIPTVDLVATQAASFVVTPNVAPTNSIAVVVVPGADCIHEVRAEDRSLYRLSLAYGLTVNEVATVNGIINPDIISVGQRLTIPGCGTTGGIPPATSTPIPTIVSSFSVGTTGSQTGGATSAVFVVPPDGDCSWGTTVIFPSGCPTGVTTSALTTDGTGTGGATAGTASRRHTVQQGESLFAISLQYGVSMSEIAALISITNVDYIDLGDVLLIP